MDVGCSLEQAWDPSAPGAGALRATAIAQLYFRMTSHHPLTILIVDAMCLVFGANGATVQELVNYLGITEDRVMFGLEGIPIGMRCTARQLECEGSLVGAAPDPVVDDDALQRDRRAGTTDASSKETRYYLNYKRMLPLVYAHVTRLLLSACVTDVPPCRYVESVKQAQLAVYQKSDTSIAHAFFCSAHPPQAEGTQGVNGVVGSFEKSTGDHVDVSEAMQRKSAIRGVPCLGCSCYFLVEEFSETLIRCPRCGKDSLSLCLHVIQAQLNAHLAEKQTLVTLLPPVRHVWKGIMAREMAQASRVLAQPSPPTTSADKPQAHSAAAVSPPRGVQLKCTLAGDPFLFQQALAFMSLYRTRFASVNDAPSVVDVQEILTEQEYGDRRRGRASVADQFRSRHRHAASVQVQLISQQDIDVARRQESHQKLLKRAMLPPWLRHTTVLNDLGGVHKYTSTDDGTSAAPEADMSMTSVPWKAESVQYTHDAKGHVPTGGAVWGGQSCITGSPVAAVPPQKRLRSEADSNAQTEVTRAASFIAAHYYNDEFDAVVLPHSRRSRTRKNKT